MNKKNYLKYLTMLLATGAAMRNGGVPLLSSTMPAASSSSSLAPAVPEVLDEGNANEGSKKLIRPLDPLIHSIYGETDPDTEVVDTCFYEEGKSGDEHSEVGSDYAIPQSDAESSSDPICNPAPIDIAFRQLPEERVIIISTNRLDYLKGRLLSGEEYPISPTLREKLKELFRTPNYTDLLKQPQSKPLVIIGDKIFLKYRIRVMQMRRLEPPIHLQ